MQYQQKAERPDELQRSKSELDCNRGKIADKFQLVKEKKMNLLPQIKFYPLVYKVITDEKKYLKIDYLKEKSLK